jgi:Aldo/keto reductase family
MADTSLEPDQKPGVTRRVFLGTTLASGAALFAGSDVILGAASSSTPTMATNPTFQLGGDLTVNRLGFGAMRITGEGIWGWPADRNIALNVLRRAIELGVNLIDTADAYGPETSELLIAEALHPYPKGLVIATKGGLTRPGPGQWVPNGRAEHFKQAVDGSLKRLRLDRIDLYQLHSVGKCLWSNRSTRLRKCRMQDRFGIEREHGRNRAGTQDSSDRERPKRVQHSGSDIGKSFGVLREGEPWVYTGVSNRRRQRVEI